MQNDMETGIIGFIGCILGLYIGLYKDNRKENGSYYKGGYIGFRV